MNAGSPQVKTGKTLGVFSSSTCAFTLIELLSVVAIMAMMMAFVGPAITGIGGGNNLTAAAYDVSGALERARTFAMAHNTYTWVGFYEENAGATLSTPTAGTGQVVIALVASKDGTQIFDDGATSATLPASRIDQIDKLVRIQNVHLADLDAPAGGDAGTLAGRPADAYSLLTSAAPYPFTAQKYTFSQTVRFSPRGEAIINGASDLKRIGEIGLRPTRGTTVDTLTPNVAALQFTGIGGSVRIYQK